MRFSEIISNKKNIEAQKIFAILGELAYYNIISTKREERKEIINKEDEYMNVPLIAGELTSMDSLEITPPFFGLSAQEFSAVWNKIGESVDKAELRDFDQISFSISDEIKGKLKNCTPKEIEEFFLRSNRISE